MKLSEINKGLIDHSSKQGGYIRKRTYDVRITLNKSGEKGYVVRFGFWNKAKETFTDACYMEITDVEKIGDRIYFLPVKEQQHNKQFKLSRSDKSQNKYFTFTPSENAEKIYRANWINGTFRLKKDPECGLWYIENEKND